MTTVQPDSDTFGGSRSFRESQLSIDPRVSTGREVGWGVIATGGIAHTVTRDLLLLPDARRIAVSSRRQAGADTFAAEFGFEKAYEGHRALLADPEVEVVYIAAPHGQHYEIAKDALNAGKHILCEKAFTIDAPEARELVELAKSKNLFLMEALWSRFLPTVQRVLQIVHSGGIGEPTWVQADQGFVVPDRAANGSTRMWDVEAGGGALLDLAPYTLMWATTVFGGKPSGVHASARLTDGGVDAQTAMTLEYPGGRYAQLMCSFVAAGASSVTITGSEGMIRIPERQNNLVTLQTRHLREPWQEENLEFVGGGYGYELREVTACVQAGKTESDLMPLVETIAGMELFDEVRRQIGVDYGPSAARPVA